MAARHQRKHERSHPAVFPQRHGLQFGAPERRPRGGATVELAAPENPRLLHAIRAILFTHYRSESCVGNLNPAGNVHTHMAVSPRMGKWLYPCPKQSLKNGYGGYFPSQRVLSSSWTQRAHVPTESAVLSGGWQHTRRAGEMLLNHAQPSQKHIALKRRSGSKKRLLPYGRKQRSARSKSTGSSSWRAPPSTSVRSERFSRKRGWCESTG